MREKDNKSGVKYHSAPNGGCQCPSLSNPSRTKQALTWLGGLARGRGVDDQVHLALLDEAQQGRPGYHWHRLGGGVGHGLQNERRRRRKRRLLQRSLLTPLSLCTTAPAAAAAPFSAGYAPRWRCPVPTGMRWCRAWRTACSPAPPACRWSAWPRGGTRPAGGVDESGREEKKRRDVSGEWCQ